ncbi:unnamed protein product [Closterium sp. Yama58-4]|nr:unnamed protein product [Closterium sp. Yama58-4]
MPGSGELDSAEQQIKEQTDQTGVSGEPQSEDDADINQILEELPRATSAPPQLAELQKVYGIAPDTGAFAGSGEGDVAVKPFEDIRRDEDYEEFYKVYSGVKKLPPPVENLQLYTDSPRISAREGEMGSDGGFFGSLALDDSKLRESMEEMRRQDAERVQKEGGSANDGATPGSGGDGTDEEAFLEEMQRQVAQQQALQEREMSRKALVDKRPGQDASGANGLAAAFQGLGVGGSTPVVRDASASNEAAGSGSGEVKAGSQQQVSSPSASQGGKDSPVIVGTANVGGFMGGMSGISALGSSAAGGISALAGTVGGPGGIPPALAASLLGGAVGLDPFTTAALLQAMGGASGASGAGLEELLAAVGGGGAAGAAAGLAGVGLAGAASAAGLPVGMGLSAAAAAFAAPSQNKDKAVEAGKGAATDASAKKAGSSAAGPATPPPGAPLAPAAAASSPSLAGAAGGALPGLGSPGLGSQGAGLLGLDTLLAQGGAGLLPGMLPGAAGIAPSNLHLYEQLLRARAGAPGVDLYGGMGGMAAAAAAAAGIPGMGAGAPGAAGQRGGFGMGMGLDGFGLGGLGAPMDAFSAAAALQAARMFPGANPADMLSAMGGIQQPQQPLQVQPQQVVAGPGEKDSKDKGGKGPSQGVAAGSDVDMSSLLQAQQAGYRVGAAPYVSPDRGPRAGGARGTPPGFGGSSAGAARGVGMGASGAPGMLGPGGGGMRKRMDGASGANGANGLMGPGPGSGLGGGGDLGGGSPSVGGYSGAGGLMGGYGVGGMGMGLGSAQHSKYSSLDEVEGQMAVIAKDQHGCRFLQRKFDEGSPEEVARIFKEIKPHMVELMTDPFGNYLVQKALEVCSEVQREEILAMATENQTDLVSISLNMHGTRSVQKLIETVTAAQAVQRLTASLAGGVVTLIKDLNGNHVVQRCLQRLSAQQNEFIFNAAVSHCVEIASHRHGCCVLQRCIDFAQGQQKNRILAEVASNALVLSQDPFGNYVVQYVLDLGLPWAMEEVVVRMQGQYAPLAQQKFSSNVVEKCLKLAPDNCRHLIIQELVVSPLLGQLLQDPFANYVVQSALTVAKGPLYTALVEAIRPHLPSLRSSPYGKRILARTNLRPK